MAKKKTATQKLKTKVKRQIKSLEKRGYIVPENVKENIENANFSRLKSYENEGYKRLYNESEFLDVTTGEIMPGTTGKSYEKTKEYRQAKQTSPEYDFYNQTGYQQGGTLPDTFEQIISNVIDDLISKLHQEIPDYYYMPNGKKRYIPEKIKNNIEKRRQSILNLIEQEINAGREKELAKRLQDNSYDVALATERFVSYHDDEVVASYNILVRVVTGRTMGLDELSDNEAYSDYISGYNEPY